MMMKPSMKVSLVGPAMSPVAAPSTRGPPPSPWLFYPASTASVVVARIKVSTMLDAPPNEVWDDLADIASHVEWMADAAAIRFLSSQTAAWGRASSATRRSGRSRSPT